MAADLPEGVHVSVTGEQHEQLSEPVEPGKFTQLSKR